MRTYTYIQYSEKEYGISYSWSGPYKSSLGRGIGVQNGQ